MKQVKIIGGICISLSIAVLIIAEVILSNQLVSLGQTVTHIDSQIQTVSKENDALRYEIASYSALSVIGQKAKELGFISPQKIVTVDSEFPVALQTR